MKNVTRDDLEVRVEHNFLHLAPDLEMYFFLSLSSELSLVSD